MTPSPWRQFYIRFPDWARAEHTAVTHLRPLLTGAEAAQLITAWFFVRKAPYWRVRYLPTSPDTQACLHDRLNDLQRRQQIEYATEVVYEPETHAFGGTHGMALAHRLWYHDSRYVLAYLATTIDQPTGRRRELSILLCSTMMRAAGLDWYEQGDVWARVADHREPPDLSKIDDQHTLQARVRRLMNVDTDDLTRADGPLAETADWAAAFAHAGRDLSRLNSEGRLHRGLREILAHHIVFASNRLGLPAATQAVLAATAKNVVFGPVRPQCPPPPQATTIEDTIEQHTIVANAGSRDD